MIDPWRVNACFVNPGNRLAMPFYGTYQIKVRVAGGGLQWTGRDGRCQGGWGSGSTLRDTPGAGWSFGTALAATAWDAKWNGHAAAPAPSAAVTAALAKYATWLRPPHHEADPVAVGATTLRETRNDFAPEWWAQWLPAAARLNGPRGMAFLGFAEPQEPPHAPPTENANQWPRFGSMAHNPAACEPLATERVTPAGAVLRLNMMGLGQDAGGTPWTVDALIAAAYADAIANGAPPGGWPAPGL